MKRDKILDYFEYKHLPPKLQRYSKPFSDLANQASAMYNCGEIHDIAEYKTALRKLLEAKDAFVRSSILRED